jgi:hypothetical protein
LRAFSIAKSARKTNISQAHREAFEALRDSQSENFALFSCFVDDEPACAIVSVTRDATDPEQFRISPLFVSVTSQMRLADHDGVEP